VLGNNSYQLTHNLTSDIKQEQGCRFIESPMPDQRNSCCDFYFCHWYTWK